MYQWACRRVGGEYSLTYLPPDIEQAVHGAASEARGVGRTGRRVHPIAASVGEGHGQPAEASGTIACPRTVGTCLQLSLSTCKVLHASPLDPDLITLQGGVGGF